jgi:excisionase family DNA binding protein
MVDNRYYTVQTAAETLAIDDEQVLSFIHSGHLKAVNLAKPSSRRPRWRIAEGELGRFLLTRLHPASAAGPAIKKATPRPKPAKQYV